MNLYFICGFFKISPRYILRSISMYRGLFYENQILPFIYMCICINKKITARNTFVGFKQKQVIFKQRKRLHAKNISYSRLWWKKQQQKKYKKKLPWIVVFYQDSHRETGCRNLVQLELNRTTARQCFRLFLLCFIYTRYDSYSSFWNSGGLMFGLEILSTGCLTIIRGKDKRPMAWFQ